MIDQFDRLAYEFSAFANDWVPFVYDWFPSLYGRPGFVLVLLALLCLARRARGGVRKGSVEARGQLAQTNSVPPPPIPMAEGRLEQQLLDRVAAGAERLSVSGLADELGVSAEDVRAAFDALAQKGLLRL